MSEFEKNLMEQDYKLSDGEKTLNNNNEVANNIFIEDHNGVTLNESIRHEKILDTHNNEIENDIFINDPNRFTTHQSIQYSSTNLEATGAEPETYLNGSEDISKDLKSINSEIISINKETINNQIVVIEPNNPVMVRFQNKLKQHLVKQRENIKKELLTQDGMIRLKQNEKSTYISEINNVTRQVKSQHSLLSEFHRMKLELEGAKEQVETYIKQGKHRCTEISTKITTETKKITDLKRQVDCSQGLLNELVKYEKEQEITFNICSQRKSETKQYKKKLLNEQQKQDLLLLSLTQENHRLEDRRKELGEQAEAKYNESELLKQKLMDSSTDLDAINEDNAKITLLCNEVLTNIQQRDKLFQKIKNDLQNAKDNYHTLVMENNSYNNSAQDEYNKNDDFINLSNKLKREQNNLRNSFKIYLNKFNNLKDEYSKIIQMTDFQHQNLNQVLFDQGSIQTEINTLLQILNKCSNTKLKYEQEILDELRKQLYANNHSIKLNNKISELKNQNTENKKTLIGVDNNLATILIKQEQNRNTCLNLDNDLKENTKYLNEQGLALSVLDSELKKICYDIKNKSRQIDIENNQLEILKKKLEEGTSITPQMQIDQVRYNIDEVEKEIDLIKQSWVQKQNIIVQLLDNRNKQFNELNKLCKYASIMDSKNTKIEREIVSLSKEDDQYKRTLSNMRNTILKLNKNVIENKGKSSQLSNENGWMQCSYLAELEENEKQCLDYIDQLKLLKNELNDIKNVYVEKQRESKSWDTKVQSLVEMKKEMMKKEGDLGDIEATKIEIHRMQIKEDQLKKNLEKVMIDLEVCISRREMIYNKVAAKTVQMKVKNKTKQQLLKKMDDLRSNIKKIKMDSKKLERTINNLQHNKMELECKITYLKDRLNEGHKNINDIVIKIEDIGATKIKNIHNISYKQNHAQFLDEVLKGKYRLLIKSASKINEELTSESKKNSELIDVLEALKNDFPNLDFQITRLLNIVKSTEN